jgi:hypothetical protein
LNHYKSGVNIYTDFEENYDSPHKGLPVGRTATKSELAYRQTPSPKKVRQKGKSVTDKKKNNNWKKKLPSYEDYKNGRMSELDVMLENVK